jgi:hypothetical protein
MNILLNVLTGAAFVAAVIGIISPEKVVFWKKENATRQDVMRWYVSIFILLALLTAYLNTR